ncbi:hypothetical protein BOTBODRAFT_38662 [Botryobasidium botryosum FD-172 SS1]|uniref:Riboflavin kinase n=1 Tax=Botryobasidium botryosum (strain FD-172 SS1) TaxID=930990 RepID=A0A067M6R9_BOTB1|nr:hypothetical protein BOTBODRAFT_38662 [Botryobasidium botryosum FD-172 SS1]
MSSDEAHASAAPLSTKGFRLSRPSIVGHDTPVPPFPIYLSGVVQRGFGRGGRDLGCHTANLPDEALEPLASATHPGIYFGYARVRRDRGTGEKAETEEIANLTDADLDAFPMAMSLGFNPYYKNKKMTAEVHIIHEYPSDFYHHYMDVVVLGYIRPELDYTSRDLEALIQDIDTDKRVTLASLDRPAYRVFAQRLRERE